MISKAKLKELAVYKQQKRCDEDHVFIVEGVKLCEEALSANMPIRAICATISWLSAHPNLPENTQIFDVDNNSLERISHLRTPNEVWMLVSQDYIPNLTVSCQQSPLIIALDHLQDPGNFGTIIRTADWFGIRHIICSTDTVSCYNPKVVQATMGGIFRTRIEYLDLPTYLASYSQPIFGALLDGDDIWASPAPLQLSDKGGILVIGNESRGITPEVQQLVTHRVKIPNLGGTAESLNASVAAAILISELVRKN